MTSSRRDPVVRPSAALTAVLTAALLFAPSFGLAYEPEELVEIRGTVTRDGDTAVMTDEQTGERFVLEGFEDPTAAVSGMFRLVEDGAGNLVPAIVRADDLPGADELLMIPKASDTTVRLSRAIVDGLKFPAAVERQARRFVTAYGEYREAALAHVTASLRTAGITGASKAYDVITKANKAAYAAYRSRYDGAIAACDDYIEACRVNGVWKGVDPQKTYLDIHKGTGLVRVVDPSTGVTLLAVPFAFGANPDGGAKQRSGDLRTPHLPPSLCSPAATPFFVGRRTNGTAAPGMTTRVMGVSSSRPEDAFWVSHGMNIALHGTPDKWSMGLRASHGCCRIIDGHIIHVFNLTAVNTKIVLHGADDDGGSTTTPPLAVGSTGVVAVQTTLNVRSGPSTDHGKVGELQGGQRVRILAVQDGWYRIEGGGLTGWVSADFIRP